MIRVFVASNAKWQEHERVLDYSIRANTQADVDVQFIWPKRHDMAETGCTTFTNVRWAVPELAGYQGRAIYLDIDMLVLGDIAELWAYGEDGAFVCMKDGRTEVMVMDCTLQVMPQKSALAQYKKWHLLPMAHPYLKPKIPWYWNHREDVNEQTRLIHFTNLDRQPWFVDRDDGAAKVLRNYQQMVA